MLKYIALFFSVTFVLAACRGNNQEIKVIPHDQMIDLLVDMHLIDGSIYATVSQNPDTLYKYDMARFLVLFRHYHTDSATFRRSLRYYTNQPTELSGMYVEIMARLQKKLDSVTPKSLKNYNGPRPVPN